MNKYDKIYTNDRGYKVDVSGIQKELADKAVERCYEKETELAEKTYGENGELYYIIYQEDEIVTKEVIEKNDYKYRSYAELGKEYFPEFDFYNAG